MRKLTATLFAFALMFTALPALAADAPATAPNADLDAFLNEIATVQPSQEMSNHQPGCEIPEPAQPEDCICPAIFDPVCGCNGETYSNDCFASCEVLRWTEGECESTSTS